MARSCPLQHLQVSVLYSYAKSHQHQHENYDRVIAKTGSDANNQTVLSQHV